MKCELLSWILGVAIGTVALASCNGETKPSAESASSTKATAVGARTAVWQKKGKAFRAKWVWSTSTVGSAQVVLTITPTVAGQSLDIRVKLPQGVGHVSGQLSRNLATPAANAPVTLNFGVGFPADVVPVIPVEVLLVLNGVERSADKIVLHDPAVPVPKAQVVPGRRTDIGGFPAKVVGEAKPPKDRND